MRRDGLCSKRYPAKILGLICAFLFLISSQPAFATLLNGGAGLGGLKTIPDIKVSSVEVKFVSAGATGTLTITGAAEALDTDNVPPPDDYTLLGDFTLTATISSAGSLVGTGAFSVTQPAIPSIPGSGPLLTGTISQFGYQGVSPFRLFDFIATGVTGDANSAPSSLVHFGPSVAIALDAVAWKSGQAFTGSFATSFLSTSLGNMDIFPVPEPSGVALTMIGLAAVGAFVGRRFSCLVRPTQNV
jgi:hypothetical protein